jgi:integrase
MALLLYGAGLRLLECCRLRVKDVDFAMASEVAWRDIPTCAKASPRAREIAFGTRVGGGNG